MSTQAVPEPGLRSEPEAFRDALAEVLSDPDHAQCREGGAKAEADCIAEGLFHRGWMVSRTHEAFMNQEASR
jgi:hypothetical protein